MISGNKCQNCGKGIMYGHNVSHSKRRTRKIFKPNLHVGRVMVGGVSKRMKLCTKCMRKFKNQMSKVKNENKNSKVLEASPQTSVSAQV